MNYIIHPNSELISTHFYRLSRPLPLPAGDEIYQIYQVITHPTDGRKAFAYDVDSPVLVSHFWTGINAVDLTTAIGGMNQGQINAFNNQLQAAIRSVQGQTEPASGYVLGRFPSIAIMTKVGESKSRTFMENDGWFSTDPF